MEMDSFNIKKWVVGPLLQAFLILGLWVPGWSADHRDGSIAQDQPADIADTYAFLNETNGKIVLAVTVNPYTVPGVAASFSTDVLYQIKIDNTGDFEEDLVIQAVFDGLGNNQKVTILGPAKPRLTGPTNRLLTDQSPRSFRHFSGRHNESDREVPTFKGPVDGTIQLSNDNMKVFVGRVDDPFFIDLIFVRSILGVVPPLIRQPGIDLFAGLNVSLIAVEIDPSVLRGPTGDTIRVWSTTSRSEVTVRSAKRDNEDLGKFVQIDREGLPAVNATLIPPARRNEFNRLSPESDIKFRQDIIAAVEKLNGGDTDHAKGIADILLPDVLTLNMTSALGFPGNSRRYDDDFIDPLLDILSKGAVTADGVNANDVPFLNDFPFFPPEHQPSEPIPARN
jgi:hypothetical protein